MLVALPGQGDHDPGGGLAAADDTDVPRPAAQVIQVLPVTAAVQDERVIVWLAGHGDRRAGAGHDDPVRLERAAAGQPQPPAAGLGLQRGHFVSDDLGPALHGDFTQVRAPLAMRRPEAAAIHPVGVAASGDQVPRPAVGHHRVGHRARGRTPARRVGVADVLLGWGAQRQRAVGVALPADPVRGRCAPFDEHHPGWVESRGGERPGLRGDRDALRARTDHRQCPHGGEDSPARLPGAAACPAEPAPGGALPRVTRRRDRGLRAPRRPPTRR